jgi:hypothetical protein
MLAFSSAPVTHIPDQFAAERMDKAHVSEHPKTHGVLGSDYQTAQVFRSADDFTKLFGPDGKRNARILNFEPARNANFGVHEFPERCHSAAPEMRDGLVSIT